MPNYHSCKEELINLIPHNLTDIYKTVKLSHLEKLQIIQNVNKLMGMRKCMDSMHFLGMSAP